MRSRWGLLGLTSSAHGWFDVFHSPKFREPVERQRVSAANVQDVFPTRCWSKLAELVDDHLGARTPPPVLLEKFAIWLCRTLSPPGIPALSDHRSAQSASVTGTLRPSACGIPFFPAVLLLSRLTILRTT